MAMDPNISPMLHLCLAMSKEIQLFADMKSNITYMHASGIYIFYMHAYMKKYFTNASFVSSLVKWNKIMCRYEK